MKRKLAAMVMAAMATAAIAVGPASADDFDYDDEFFFSYPLIAVVEDVDFENVRERNDRYGECFVDDLDLDGFIAEYEITCYY